MGIEIERKYLLQNEAWRVGATGLRCCQGYLCTGPPVAIRVRIMGDTATLNLKKAVLDITRDEFEYEIPMADAEHLLQHLCQGHPIEKTRYRLPYADLVWEIDEFHGANAGLVVAEVELEAADQVIALPPWVGREVSDDPRYLNACLSRCPYSQWEESELEGA